MSLVAGRAQWNPDSHGGDSPRAEEILRVFLPGALQLLRSVMIRGVLAGLVGVVLGVGHVAVRDVGMVAGLFVISGGVMFGRRAMVLRGAFMVFRRSQVVFFTFFRHGFLFLRYESRLEDTPGV